MMARTTRDWRGIKHQLGDYTTEELIGVLNNAEQARAQVVIFAARVATELSRRGWGETDPAGLR